MPDDGLQGTENELKKIAPPIIAAEVIGGAANGAYGNSSLADVPPEVQKRSVTHAAITGAGIGAVLYPALGLIFDAFSRNKVMVPGNRIKFLASQASIGAALNGALNAAIAWGQNKVNRKHAEKVQAEKPCGCDKGI